MTEKRYKLSEPNGAYLIDGDRPYAHWINDDDKIIDLLNEQHETITEQASQIDFLKDENAHMRTVLNENKQLKQTCQMVEDTYHALQKKFHNWDIALDKCRNENKELKQTIDEVRSMDKEKDIEVEHINNIYKEFGFKGIMDYAKDKLQNYGAVREVDDGLWLLATGGWSDNEHWLHCLLDWNFLYGKGHYRATTSGGGYYYSEKPYADISVLLNNTKGDME